MSVDPVRFANPRRAISFRPPMWDEPATNQDTAAKHDAKTPRTVEIRRVG
jgi:hypothetical protein